MSEEKLGLEDLQTDLSVMPITLKNGRTYELELQESLAECAENSDAIPDEVSFYSKLLGALEQEVLLADAGYRQWLGKWKLDALEQNSKISEWKIKAEAESTDEFDRRKRIIAESTSCVTAIRGHINALMILAGRPDLATPLSIPHEGK